MDVSLRFAVAALVIAIAASIVRYRVIAIAAALIGGGAVVADYYGNSQGMIPAPDAPAGQESTPVQAHGGAVAWSRLYLDATSEPQPGKPATISSFSITGTNVSSGDIKFDEIYFVSGADGTRIDVQIGRDGMRYKIRDLAPLPPGAFFFVVSDSIGPTKAGLATDDFLKKWATISFVAKYDGATQQIEFDRRTVQSLLPNPSQP
jgi:hypothetical protein